MEPIACDDNPANQLSCVLSGLRVGLYSKDSSHHTFTGLTREKKWLGGQTTGLVVPSM